MKAIFLSTLALSLSLLSRAQIKKGDILLGGNLGFSSASPEPNDGTNAFNNAKNTFFNIRPTIGKAIKDNLVLGINLLYSYNRSTYAGANYYKMTGYGAGVFLRRYIPLGKGFYFFLQEEANASFYRQNNGNTTPGFKANETNLSLSFYPGVAYAIDRHWQIETGFPQLAALSYDHQKRADKVSGGPDLISKYNTFGISSSLSSTYQLTVGLRYFIGS